MKKEEKIKRKQSVARAAGAVSILTLTSRVFGLTRDMVVANAFGAGMVSDAFFVAFKLPNLLRRLVAEGALATAFVPIFIDELETHPERAKLSVRQIVGFSLLLTVTLSLLGVYYSEQVVRVFAPGFLSSSEKAALAIDLTRIMLPYIVFVSLLALTAGILNSLGVFAIPATAPIVLNLVMISAVVVVSPRLAEPIYALAWSVIAGGLLGLLAPAITVYKLGYSLFPASPFRSPVVKSLLKLMIPSMFSASLYQLTVFINTVLASMLQEGSVSWLYYGDRLFQFPLGVFSVALATAVLPTLSRHASRGDSEAFNNQYITAINWVSIICIPATFGLLALALPITKAIFEHGDFTSSSSTFTALALSAYAFGLWPLSAQTILIRVFFAKKNSMLPAIVSGFSLLANLVFALILMGPPAAIADDWFSRTLASLQTSLTVLPLGHVGLAFASTFTAFTTFFVLLTQLPKVGVHISLSKIAPALLQSVLGAILMLGPIYVLSGWNTSVYIYLPVVIVAAGFVYGTSLTLLGNKEARLAFNMIRSRLSP